MSYVDVPLFRQNHMQGGPDKRWSQGLLGRREAIYHERRPLARVSSFMACQCGNGPLHSSESF